MMAKTDYKRIAPPKKKPHDPKAIRQKLREFDPDKTMDMYLAQSREHGTRFTEPKRIYEIHEQNLTQAERVIKKFGGVPELIRALEKTGKILSRSTVYRWIYSKERGGTGGLIPTSIWPNIFVAARLEGVFLTSEEIDARDQYVKNFKTVASTVNGKLVPFIDSLEWKALQQHELNKQNRLEIRRKRSLERRQKALAKKKMARELKEQKKKAKLKLSQEFLSPDKNDKSNEADVLLLSSVNAEEGKK